WRIVFQPRAGMYAKANEAGLILRELARLGPVAVELDAGALPDLESLAPEEAYLVWQVTLESEADEATIREAFEFVEDDCRLEIVREDTPAEAADEGLDIAALLAIAQGPPPPEAAPAEPVAALADPAPT